MPPVTRQGAALALPAPGDIIAGKYAIVRVLGEGGMGVVFEATHLKLRQRVAVKMLQPQMLEHEIIVSRFEREARASGQLRNRHVARVMDVDVTAEGLPYMVMEFLEGRDLQAELNSRGRLSSEEVVDDILQACSAMMEAHQLGIVHRDLKPANLFLAVDGDTRILKVLDFGISKVHSEGDAKLTCAESVMGTAMYMSPEQLRSADAVDARSDIWSLGIILYELLSGRPPWIGTPTQVAAAIVTEDAPDLLTHIDGGVPPELAAIVMKALKREPAERFDDVRQLAVALAPFASSSGVGRILAEGLLSGGSGMFPRLTVRPGLEGAPTIVQAAAVSQPRNPGEGTTPGWSQHNQPAARARTVLVGFIAAFAVGLIVVSGIVLAWLRWGASPGDRTTATAPPAAASSLPALPAASPVQPSPSPIDAPPPVTGQPPSPAPPESAAPARPRAPVTRPAAAKPTMPPAPPPPPPAHPSFL